MADTLAQALLLAQSEMQGPKKTAKNTHFKSTYATLEDVLDACVPVLNKHGIVLTQGMVQTDAGSWTVATTLIHAPSDEHKSFSIPVILGKEDMQGLGSAITYARRYGALMACGVAPEDDDGNATRAAPKPNPSTESLNDAWRDGVLDSLPENATPEMKAQAFADALCDMFAGYKSVRGLDAAWEKRGKIIDNLRDRFPPLWEQVVDAFETRKMELEGNHTSKQGE